MGVLMASVPAWAAVTDLAPAGIDDVSIQAAAEFAVDAGMLQVLNVAAHEELTRFGETLAAVTGAYAETDHDAHLVTNTTMQTGEPLLGARGLSSDAAHHAAAHSSVPPHETAMTATARLAESAEATISAATVDNAASASASTGSSAAASIQQPLAAAQPAGSSAEAFADAVPPPLPPRPTANPRVSATTEWSASPPSQAPVNASESASLKSGAAKAASSSLDEMAASSLGDVAPSFADRMWNNLEEKLTPENIWDWSKSKFNELDEMLSSDTAGSAALDSTSFASDGADMLGMSSSFDDDMTSLSSLSSGADAVDLLPSSLSPGMPASPQPLPAADTAKLLSSSSPAMSVGPQAAASETSEAMMPVPAGLAKRAESQSKRAERNSDDKDQDQDFPDGTPRYPNR